MGNLLSLGGCGCQPSAVCCLGVRQQELGTHSHFLILALDSAEPWRLCRKLREHYSLCLSRDLCPHHSLPSLMFRSTFPHSFIHSFLPSSSFSLPPSLPPSLPLPSFPPFPLPFSSIIYLINILLTFFPRLLLELWSGSLALAPSALTCSPIAILSPSKLNLNHSWQKSSS